MGELFEPLQIYTRLLTTSAWSAMPVPKFVGVGLGDEVHRFVLFEGGCSSGACGFASQDCSDIQVNRPTSVFRPSAHAAGAGMDVKELVPLLRSAFSATLSELRKCKSQHDGARPLRLSARFPLANTQQRRTSGSTASKTARAT